MQILLMIFRLKENLINGSRKEELISKKKDWKQVDGGMQRKWKIKRVSKRVCQMDQLSNQFIGLEYQVRNGKVLSKNEIIGKRHQLIIKRTFLFKP